MGLHAVRAADDQHRRVQHLQRALRLGREIGVAGRVEQEKPRPRQLEHRLLGEDRDAALPLELVRVQKAVPVVDAPELFDAPGAVEHRLGERGLPGVHVREDAQHHIPFCALLRHEPFLFPFFYNVFFIIS